MPRFLAPLLLPALLLATFSPVIAQTSDVWTNTKISDLRRHQQEVSAPAAEKLNMAAFYVERVQRLTQEDGELTPKQQRKLDKAYKKAARNLEEAIEIAPGWMEPRLHLAALHYTVQAYGEAVRCYEDALELEPDDEKIRAYLETATWYRDRAKEDSSGDAADGR